MGLERATTLRQLAYQDLVKEKQALELQISNTTATLQTIERDNSIQQAQDNIENVNRLAENERQTIVAQIAQVDKELEGQVVLSPEAARLRDQLTEAESRRAALVAERNTETNEAYGRFVSQRDSYTARLNSPTATDAQKKRWDGELAKLVNPVPALQAKYGAEIEIADQQIKSLRSEFDSARNRIASTTSVQRTALENRRAELLSTLDSTAQKWVVEKDSARKRLSDAQAQEPSRTETLAIVRKEAQFLREKLADVEGRRIVLARQDQVQRIAGRFFGKNPEDVNESEANLIASLWFGSLAALAALAGPITAIVALGLQRIGLSHSQVSSGSKLSRLIRRLIVSWRWRRVRTKIVSVEVPVDKEVVRIVKEEVPVERVVKEILYVPILTDDPEAVKRSLYANLPDEVAEMVKVSLVGKGSQHGSPA